MTGTSHEDLYDKISLISSYNGKRCWEIKTNILCLITLFFSKILTL